MVKVDSGGDAVIPTPDFHALAQWGLAATIAIAVVRYLMSAAAKQQAFMQALVENHLAHNTTALLALESAIQKLLIVLESRQFQAREPPQ